MSMSERYNTRESERKWQAVWKDERVFETTTGFGFSPREALANQVGLPATEADREWLTRPGERPIDLDSLRGAAVPLAGPELLMLDRIDGCWPNAGRAGATSTRRPRTPRIRRR